jgi:hypothetical protein
MIPHDPDYVATMMEDDFDPHLLMALASGLITQQEFNDYKAGIKTDKVKNARKAGKVANYACVYGSGAETLSRGSGLDLKTCKTLIEGYWNLNWAVKTIAEEQCVIIDGRGNTWLVNPVNGFAYSLRSDKDRFSTLCQGTGSYFFDIWCDKILESFQNKWGCKSLTFTAHDENVFCVKDIPEIKDTVKGMINNAIADINTEYNLRRKLGCDVQEGDRYSEIH